MQIGRKQNIVEDLNNLFDLHFSAFVQAIQHYKVLAGMAQHSFESADNACSIGTFLVECAKRSCRQVAHQLPCNTSDDCLCFQRFRFIEATEKISSKVFRRCLLNYMCNYTSALTRLVKLGHES